MRKSKFSETQVVGILKEAERGVPVGKFEPRLNNTGVRGAMREWCPFPSVGTAP
jgi:hypothetical protein